jgi:phosphate transport system substrate-binding protein
VDSITTGELVALYAGERRTFADGTPAVMLLRDRGESANLALEQMVPGLTAARETAYRKRLLRVLYHDSAMAEALAATPGAIGVFPLGAVTTYRLPLKILALDGIRPSPAAVRQGRWRASRPLFLVVRTDRMERAAPFLSFVISPEGRRITEDSGYLPPETPTCGP